MIEEVYIDSIDRLSREIHSMTHGEWLFRGQSDAGWTLETSFFRFTSHLTRLRYCNQPLTGSAKLIWYRTLRELEHRAFAEYRDQIAPRLRNTGPLTMLAALAEIQHYGCPTRMLDFTWLPYIALFFALERGDSDFAVYAVRAAETPDMSDVCSQDEAQFWNEEGADHPKVHLFTPQYTTERIAKQKGAFLIPSTTVLPFETIAHSAGLRVMKIILRARLRGEAIAMLAKMNVTPATIYPEAEGQIRSLAWDIQSKVLSCLM